MQRDVIKKTALVIAFGALFALLAVPAIDLGGGKSADYALKGKTEILCSNPTEKSADVEFTVINGKLESDYKKINLVSKASINAKLGELFKKEIEDGSLNIYSKSEGVVCNVLRIDDSREVLAAVTGDSYLPLKSGLFLSDDAKLELVNLSDSKAKFTVTVQSSNSSNAYSYDVAGHNSKTATISYTEDSIVIISPEKKETLYNASLTINGMVEPQIKGYSNSEFVVAGEEVLVSNVSDDETKVSQIINGKVSKSFNLAPYQSKIVSKNNGEIISFKTTSQSKIIVNAIGDLGLLPIPEKGAVNKKAVINFKAGSQILVVNDSDGKDVATAYLYYTNGKNQKKIFDLNPCGGEELEVEADDGGYALINSAIGTKPFLVLEDGGDIRGIIRAEKLATETDNGKITIFTDSSNTTRSELISNDVFVNPSKIDPSLGDDKSESEEEKDIEEEKAAPESLSCLTNECIETYMNEASKRTGVLFFNFAPLLLDTPSNADIYINNYSTKQVVFTVEGYDTAGKLNGTRRITVPAGKNGGVTTRSSAVNSGAKTHRLYKVIPSVADAEYSAYIIVKNKDEKNPWHYEILPGSPLNGQSAAFNAKGTLVVANISDVPTLLHYQIFADGALRYAGDEWFLPRAQRIIDLETQLKSYKEATMTLVAKKYFVPQSCSGETCTDLNTDGQLIADMFYDGADHPVRDGSEVSGSEFGAYLSSSDAEFFVQNESEEENIVAFNYMRGIFGQDFNVVLSPYERRRIYLPEYIVDNPRANINEIRDSSGRLVISSERSINVMLTSTFNSEAKVMSYAVPQDAYTRRDLVDESKTESQPLNITCVSFVDTDREGVCNTVETAFTMNTSKKDSDSDGVDDAVELYRNLSLPTNATSKVPYQQSISFGTTNTSILNTIKSKFFKTKSYRTVTSKSEIEGVFVEEPEVEEVDLEKEACLSDACLASFQENDKKITGDSFIMYAPKLVTAPDATPLIYIHNYASQKLTFKVMGYSIDGKLPKSTSFSIAANTVKTLQMPRGVSAQTTYRIVPPTADTPYSAYAIVKDSTAPYHYQIQATKPLDGRAVSFVPKGKLLVGNVSDVPALLHYQIVVAGAVVYEGEQWFLARAQRVIDLDEQLKEYDSVTMHFDVKKFFLPQVCSDGSCEDDDSGQLIANMYYDGAVYPIAELKKSGSTELISNVLSADSTVDLFNEDSLVNDVTVSFSLGTASNALSFSLQPNEHRRVYIGGLIYEEPEKHLSDLREISGYINVTGEYSVSTTLKQTLASGAKMVRYALPLSSYTPVREQESAEAKELAIKCSDDNTDGDADGVCSTIETLLSMNDKNKFYNGGKDEEGVSIADGLALYKYLFPMVSSKQPLVSYQDVVRSGGGVEEEVNSNVLFNSGSSNVVKLSAGTVGTIVNKLFPAGSYRKLEGEEVDKIAEDETESTCKPIKQGVLCGNGETVECCAGECSGRGYNVTQTCCDAFSAAFQKGGQFGCCAGGKGSLLELSTNSNVKSLKGETFQLADVSCCRGDAAYPIKESSSDNEELKPDTEKDRICCNGEDVPSNKAKITSVACGSVSSQLCCPIESCTSYDFSHYFLGNEDNRCLPLGCPLSGQHHCCSSTQQTYQNKGNWGCCSGDGLVNANPKTGSGEEQVTYTYYKYGFDGYVRNIIKKDYYSLSADEKTKALADYKIYMATPFSTDGVKNGLYVELQDLKCSSSESPSPSKSPTESPSGTATVKPSSSPKTTPSGDPTVINRPTADPTVSGDPTANPRETYYPPQPPYQPSTVKSPVSPQKTSTPTRTPTRTPTKTPTKTPFPSVSSSPSTVPSPACPNTIPGTDLKCSGSKPCAVHHGTSMYSGGCCPSTKYTWCEGRCCLSSQCLNPYGDPNSGGEEKCCASGTKPCGTISCCKSGMCAGKGSTAVCCNDGESVCGSSCCSGTCVSGVCIMPTTSPVVIPSTSSNPNNNGSGGVVIPTSSPVVIPSTSSNPNNNGSGGVVIPTSSPVVVPSTSSNPNNNGSGGVVIPTSSTVATTPTRTPTRTPTKTPTKTTFPSVSSSPSTVPSPGSSGLANNETGYTPLPSSSYW